MICAMCGRPLKGTGSVERGYGPVCYRKINPPAVKRKLSAESYNLADDVNYHVPGKMELSDFMEMPEGFKENSSDKDNL